MITKDWISSREKTTSLRYYYVLGSGDRLSWIECVTSGTAVEFAKKEQNRPSSLTGIEMKKRSE